MVTLRPPVSEQGYPIPPDAPFQVGDHVITYTFGPNGRPMIEGHAVVVAGGATRGSYLVKPIGSQPAISTRANANQRFSSALGYMPVYRRVKTGLSQTAPFTYLKMLNAAYRVRGRHG